MMGLEWGHSGATMSHNAIKWDTKESNNGN